MLDVEKSILCENCVWKLWYLRTYNINVILVSWRELCYENQRNKWFQNVVKHFKSHNRKFELVSPVLHEFSIIVFKIILTIALISIMTLLTRLGICQIFYTSKIPNFFIFTPEKRVNCNKIGKKWEVFLQLSSQIQTHSNCFVKTQAWIRLISRIG